MIEQILNFLITPAHADTAIAAAAAQPQQGGGMSFVLLMAIFIAFMYFFMWRPQAKRAKEQQSLLTSLTKGDEVVTAGGLIGKINKVADQYIELSIANETDIVIQKSAVVSVLPKGTIKSIG